MSKSIPMTEAEMERKWRAEEDARVLKRAMEIQKDKTRQKEAKKLIAEELKTLQNLVGVNKKAPAKKAPAKGKKK